MCLPPPSTHFTTGTFHSSDFAMNRGIRPCAMPNAMSKIGSENETWLPTRSAPPVFGRCSPPRQPSRVPHITNGQITSMARPNQNPEVRRRRRRVCRIRCHTVSDGGSAMDLFTPAGSGRGHVLGIRNYTHLRSPSVVGSSEPGEDQ
jgi:hypothetical protein